GTSPAAGEGEGADQDQGPTELHHLWLRGFPPLHRTDRMDEQENAWAWAVSVACRPGIDGVGGHERMNKVQGCKRATALLLFASTAGACHRALDAAPPD